MKKETLTIILGLCLLFATVTAIVPTSARAQNDAPPPPHTRSPAMVQAGQAFQRGDYAGAAAVMRTAAQHGDLEAQGRLGGGQGREGQGKEECACHLEIRVAGDARAAVVPPGV